MVANLLGNALVLVSPCQPGVDERRDIAAADLSRNALHDVEQAVKERQRVGRKEQPLLADHSALAGQPQDRNLVVEIATTAIPAVVHLVASGQRRVKSDDAGGLALV